MWCQSPVLSHADLYIVSKHHRGGNITSGKCIAASSLAVGPQPPTVVGDAAFNCTAVMLVSSVDSWFQHLKCLNIFLNNDNCHKITEPAKS